MSTLEDAVDIGGYPPEIIDHGNAVRHQTAVFDILTKRATRGQPALLRQLGDKPRVRAVFWLVAYKDRIRTFLLHCRKHAPVFCFLKGAFKGWTYQRKPQVLSCLSQVNRSRAVPHVMGSEVPHF